MQLIPDCTTAYHVFRLLELAVEIPGSHGEDDSVCMNDSGIEREHDRDIRACMGVVESARIDINIGWFERYARRDSRLEARHVASAARLAVERHGVRFGWFGVKWRVWHCERRIAARRSNANAASGELEVVRLRYQASF